MFPIEIRLISIVMATGSRSRKAKNGERKKYSGSEELDGLFFEGK
jgi:hypothetical protein